MAVYRVQVRCEGVLRVEADSADEAEAIAQRARAQMSGRKLFGAQVEAECRGPVERTTHQPDRVVQKMTGGMI